ncbi:MAG TPA: Lrp/AsnC family transcriptional regulator [Candidatus Sulfotelmatobacter sp.]|jgi:DNA-binding Lrp family transcriptional regulator|nr:Lrp/AsnC family transcriptional regulator [Candidatus Sulfotelmatobacter sp.]
MDLDCLDRRLLDEFQRDFPLDPRPYAVLGERLGVDEETVRQRLERLKASGSISRVGAVFKPHAVGASTLAALAVPPADLERVAAIVSAMPEVNHNYQREHDFNLWFVVCAADEAAVRRTLREIRRQTGLEPLDLPLLEDFHIDLGFPLWN